MKLQHVFYLALPLLTSAIGTASHTVIRPRVGEGAFQFRPHPTNSALEVQFSKRRNRDFKSISSSRRSSSTILRRRYAEDSLVLLRGGGGSMLHLLPTTAIPTLSTQTIVTISKFWAGCMLLLGTLPMVAPVSFVNTWCMKGCTFPRDIVEDSFESSLLQSIGTIIVGLAIHQYLVLSSVLLPRNGVEDASHIIYHSMGYALLPRALLILWSFLRARLLENKTDYQFKGTAILKFNFVLMCWTSYALLTGTGNNAISAKVFATTALMKALSLAFMPVKMTEKLFGVNVAGQGKRKINFASKL